MLKGFVGRRIAQRVPFMAEITIRFDVDSKMPTIATATNLSSGGMQFTIPKGQMMINPEEKLELVFQLPNIGETSVHGEICYYSNAVNADKIPVVCYGTKFTDMSMETWKQVNEYCQAKQQEIETAEAGETNQTIALQPTPAFTPVAPAVLSTPIPAPPFAPVPPPPAATTPIPGLEQIPNQAENSVAETPPDQMLSQDKVDQLIRSMRKGQTPSAVPPKSIPPKPPAAPAVEIPRTAPPVFETTQPAPTAVPLVFEPAITTATTPSAPEAPPISNPAITAAIEQKAPPAPVELPATPEITAATPAAVMPSLPASESGSLMDLVLGQHNPNVSQEQPSVNLPAETGAKDAEPSGGPPKLKPLNTSGPTLMDVMMGIHVPAAESQPVEPSAAPPEAIPAAPETTEKPEETVTVTSPETTAPATGASESDFIPFEAPAWKQDYSSPVIKGSSTVSMDQDAIDRMLKTLIPTTPPKKPVTAAAPAPIPPAAQIPVTPTAPPVITAPAAPVIIPPEPDPPQAAPPVATPPPMPSIPMVPTAPPASTASPSALVVSLTMKGRSMDGLLENINFGGMMVRVPESIGISEAMRISISHSQVPLNGVPGVCASCEAASVGSPEFRVSVFFENISSSDFDKLRQLTAILDSA
jgi:hypothetical protein